MNSINKLQRFLFNRSPQAQPPKPSDPYSCVPELIKDVDAKLSSIEAITRRYPHSFVTVGGQRIYEFAVSKPITRQQFALYPNSAIPPEQTMLALSPFGVIVVSANSALEMYLRQRDQWLLGYNHLVDGLEECCLDTNGNPYYSFTDRVQPHDFHPQLMLPPDISGYPLITFARNDVILDIQGYLGAGWEEYLAAVEDVHGGA